MLSAFGVEHGEFSKASKKKEYQRKSENAAWGSLGALGGASIAGTASGIYSDDAQHHKTMGGFHGRLSNSYKKQGLRDMNNASQKIGEMRAAHEMGHEPPYGARAEARLHNTNAVHFLGRAKKYGEHAAGDAKKAKIATRNSKVALGTAAVGAAGGIGLLGRSVHYDRKSRGV